MALVGMGSVHTAWLIVACTYQHPCIAAAELSAIHCCWRCVGAQHQFLICLQHRMRGPARLFHVGHCWASSLGLGAAGCGKTVFRYACALLPMQTARACSVLSCGWCRRLSLLSSLNQPKLAVSVLG